MCKKILILITIFILLSTGCAIINPDGFSKTKKQLPARVKVAAAQVEIHTGNEIDKAVEFIHKAGGENAELIVLGEYLLGPFYKDCSESIKRISQAANKHNIYVIIGGWEEFEYGAFKAKKKNGYANTSLLFGRNGTIIGRYSKVHKAIGEPPYFWPPKGTEAEWLMRTGNSYPIFDLDFGRIGIMTCYDGYFPESALILSLKGAEIIAWINGRAGPIEDYIVKADMFRNYCSIITTNLAPGSGTMIGMWPNSILAKVSQTGNHYISAELDLAKLRLQRKNSRVFHQRRPKVYNAIVQKHKPWEIYEKNIDD